MAMRQRYEYGTSPRKLEPDYTVSSKQRNKRIKVVENKKTQNVKVSKDENKMHFRTVVTVLGVIALLLTVSCRNSQIDKKFDQIQDQKKQLSTLQKENEQLKVSIENSINISNIEKIAKDELGMQKLSSKQTVYITLPKKDYIETAPEQVKKQENKSWLQKLAENLTKRISK